MIVDSHNEGGFERFSPFTAWTRNPDRALFFARQHGLGGVLLRLDTRAPQPQEPWSWEWSPDEYGEEEMLLRGVRLGAEVFDA